MDKTQSRTNSDQQLSKQFFGFSVLGAKGEDFNLARYSGQVVLVVNVASRCGFTPQYAGLEDLHRKYSAKGLVILGFPCNQFGSQEPGSNSEIQEFCSLNFGVSFPVLAKVDVNGKDAAPVFQWLKTSAPGIFGTEAIKWNFTKFLIGKDGKVIKRYSPQDEPQSLTGDIEMALKA